MDKNKAEQIIVIANEVLKLQELFKEVKGSPFTVSQNLLDAVHNASGFLEGLNSKEETKEEK